MTIANDEQSPLRLLAKRWKVSKGRNLRILMIGNIANNAYLNAKILNAHGVDSYVCSIRSKHIMSCPEWEDADFISSLDQVNPDWSTVELGGFARPDWFISGSLVECLDKLIDLFPTNGCPSNHNDLSNPSHDFRNELHLQHACRELVANLARKFGLAQLEAGWKDRVRHYTTRPLDAACRVLNRLGRDSATRQGPVIPGFDSLLASGLKKSDITPHVTSIPLWIKALKPFDVVIGYGIEGMYALLASKRPYVAFEHGTIRALPFLDNALGRLCSTTFRKADHVIITNCDAIRSVDRLNLKHFTFIPHPVNEVLPPPHEAETLGYRLRKELDSDFVVFHPARQHWNPNLRDPSLEKGNDIFIRGLALANQQKGQRIGAVMVTWGATLNQSQALIQELGISDLIKWIEPLPHIRMVEMIVATNAVADQFYLGAFGSLTPKGLMLGRPVLLNLDESIHQWCFDKIPPVLNTKTPQQVADALIMLSSDAAACQKYSELGAEWYRTSHSNEAISRRFADVLKQVAPISTML